MAQQPSGWPDRSFFRFFYNLYLLFKLVLMEACMDCVHWYQRKVQVQGDVTERTRQIKQKTNVDFSNQTIINSFSALKRIYYKLMVVDMKRTAMLNGKSPNPEIIDFKTKLKRRYATRQPRTLEERFDAAKTLEELQNSFLPLAVDKMNNEANFAFGGLPERMLVVFDSKITFLSGIGPYFFDVKELQHFLTKITTEKH